MVSIQTTVISIRIGLDIRLVTMLTRAVRLVRAALVVIDYAGLSLACGFPVALHVRVDVLRVGFVCRGHAVKQNGLGWPGLLTFDARELSEAEQREGQRRRAGPLTAHSHSEGIHVTRGQAQ